MNILKPVHKILEKYYREESRGINLKLLINRSLDSGDPRHNAAVTRAVYGVIRNDIKLTAIAEYVSSRKIKKFDIKSAVAIKTALFLLFLSDSYQQYAVVNDTVTASPKRSKAFINAVLRNCLRKREEITEQFINHKDPSINYSISRELIEAAEEVFGQNNSVAEYLSREPVFHVHPHPGNMVYGELREALKENDIDSREIKSLKSFEISNPGSVIRTFIKDDKCYIQNSGSQLVSIIANKFGGRRVLDICAAPGTKSITLHYMSEGKRSITASDISSDRIKMLDELCRRLGISINCLSMDAAVPAIKDEFDIIILDAPCSSAGTCRKNPDLKIKTDNKAIKENSEVQKKITSSVLSNFPSSRYILYSVCSFTKAETDNVIDHLKQHHSFSTVDLSDTLHSYGINYRKGEYGVYLVPDEEHNCDLFYFSLIERSSDK